MSQKKDGNYFVDKDEAEENVEVRGSQNDETAIAMEEGVPFEEEKEECRMAYAS